MLYSVTARNRGFKNFVTISIGGEGRRPQPFFDKPSNRLEEGQGRRVS